MTVSEARELRKRREAENRRRLEASQVPRNMPAERSWTLLSCRQAMTVWEYPRGTDQTANTIDAVEGLLFDMDTGAWECESNRGFWLDQKMRIWLDEALRVHGYPTTLWLPDLASGKALAAYHVVGSEPCPLPDWLPLNDINFRGPWPGILLEQAHQPRTYVDNAPEEYE